MAHVDALSRWLTLLVLTTTALAALAYLSRMVWRGFKLVEKVGELLEHELTHNSGSSMKDDLTRIAVHLGRLQADVRDLTRSKQTAHDALQVQLDTIYTELGIPETDPQHGAGSHKKGRP